MVSPGPRERCQVIKFRDCLRGRGPQWHFALIGGLRWGGTLGDKCGGRQRADATCGPWNGVAQSDHAAEG